MDKNPEWPKYEEAYDACMEMAEDLNAFCTAQNRLEWGFIIDEIKRWVHLANCLESETVSPMDVYDCIYLGYIPEYIQVRESKWSKR